MAKEREDRRAASRLQASAFKSNNFTSTEEPVEQPVRLQKEDEIIVNDEKEDEMGNHKNVEIIKNSFKQTLNLSNLKKNFEVICNFKARMSAIVKARKDRINFKKLKSVAIKIQYAVRRMLKKKRCTKIINFHKIPEKLNEEFPVVVSESIELKARQLEFIKRQQRLTEQRKKRKKAALM
jgi:hypothetical protein